MRKHNLIIGVVCLLIGIGCLCTALIFETKLDDMLSWFAGYGIVFGGLTTGKYLYWCLPKNREMRNKILAYDAIEQQDELKVSIRDKTGRYAYIFGQYLLCAAILVTGILGKLELIADAHPFLLILTGCLVLQLIFEKLVYHHISKKY